MIREYIYSASEVIRNDLPKIRFINGYVSFLVIFGLLFSFGLSIFATVILVPANVLIKRLGYLLIGVALIFGLSEVSKLVEHLSTVTTQVR